MNRRPLFPSLWNNNPAMAWMQLGWNTAEMLTTSAQVIQHRTQRMAQAGPVPNARDRREFHLMGQEKLEAAGESMQAAGWRLLQTNQQLGSLLFKQWMAWSSSMITLAATPFWLWTGREYQQWLQQAGRNASALGNHLSGSGAQLASRALHPIHSRATANARRLLK